MTTQPPTADRPALDHLSAVQAALQTDPSPHQPQEDPPKGILTVGRLRDLLHQLSEQGIDQDTAVVVANDGWYDEVSADVQHPWTDDPNVVIWLTLTPSGPADARFTSGHYRDEDETPVTAPRESATDLVGRLLARFWLDDGLAYKAGDYDSLWWVANQVHEARPDLTWSDASLRRAADLSWVMGQFGVDQTKDRQYHAAVAVVLFETTEVD